jgi:hypothetical protein
MNFTITQNDYERVMQYVGGLNFNYANDPTLNAEGRFKAFVTPEMKNYLNDFKKRLDAQITAPPTPSSVEPIDLGSLGIGTTPWTEVGPGQRAYFRSTVDGQVSCSESGGSFYCQLTVSDGAPALSGEFPNDPTVTAAQAGNTARLPIKAGQFCTIMHNAPSAIKMHVSNEG